MPELSVILPFYNVENTLKRAVNSILQQTFSDFELILINNNSTDSSGLIATKLAESDARIKLIAEKQQGVVFAMNIGMQEADGKYLARMDADDVSLPKRLENQYHFLQKNPQIGLVGCNVNHVSILPSRGFQRFVNWVNSFHTSSDIWAKRFIEIPLIQPTAMFRAKLVEKHGVYQQGAFPEDYELFLRWLDEGVRFHQLPEILHEWHDSDTRLTRTDERYSPDAFYKTKALYFAKWFQRSHPDKELWIWGAGRKSRQRAAFLENEGLIISGYYDLAANKNSQQLCCSYLEIPDRGTQFILSMVASYGASEKINAYLLSRKYQPNNDFLLMA